MLSPQGRPYQTLGVEILGVRLHRDERPGINDPCLKLRILVVGSLVGRAISQHRIPIPYSTGVQQLTQFPPQDNRL